MAVYYFLIGIGWCTITEDYAVCLGLPAFQLTFVSLGDAYINTSSCPPIMSVYPSPVRFQVVHTTA